MGRRSPASVGQKHDYFFLSAVTYHHHHNHLSETGAIHYPQVGEGSGYS